MVAARRWLLIACIAAGCAKPNDVVRVDIDRLVAFESKRPQRVVVPSSPSVLLSPTQASVDSLPQLALRDPSVVGKIDLKKAISEEQEAARRRLQARLQAIYEAEAARFEREAVRNAEPKLAELAAQGSAQIAAAIKVLASKRSRPMMRLALLAGYPDPNPESTKPSRTLRPVEQLIHDELVQRRNEIAAADREFEAKVKEILQQVGESQTEVRIDLAKRIDDFRANVNVRAENEANAEVRRSPQELGLVLTEPSRVTMSGHPAETRSFVPNATLPPLPAPTSQLDREADTIRRKAIVRQVKIWLALRGYDLAPKGSQARDATDEFRKWQTSNKVGLSVN